MTLLPRTGAATNSGPHKHGLRHLTRMTPVLAASTLKVQLPREGRQRARGA